jgi:Zn-dependent protease/CBS domain-containing protein
MNNRAQSNLSGSYASISGAGSLALDIGRRTAVKRRGSSFSRHLVPLGRIFGIPIGLDYSWFLIFALLTWTLAVGYYPASFPSMTGAEQWILGALSALLLFASVLFHELGHSVVAMYWDVPVRRITLFIFGGVAEIGGQPPTAKAEFWIAVAGPAVSFALALLFMLLEPLVPQTAPALALISYLAYMNAALFLFNLVPGFPLDGGRVLRAAVWGITRNMRKATVIAGNVGRFIGFLFILGGVWQLLQGLYLGGIWIMLIGWFLESAAISQIQQQRLHALLGDYRVANAMSRDYATAPGESSLLRLVDREILGGGRRCFMVKDGESATGLLTLHRIKEIPRSQWAGTTASEAMVPMEQLRSIRPDADLWTALKQMDRDGVNQLPVLIDGEMVGMLSRKDLISYMQTIQELGG